MIWNECEKIQNNIVRMRRDRFFDILYIIYLLYQKKQYFLIIFLSLNLTLFDTIRILAIKSKFSLICLNIFNIPYGYLCIRLESVRRHINLNQETCIEQKENKNNDGLQMCLSESEKYMKIKLAF